MKSHLLDNWLTKDSTGVATAATPRSLWDATWLLSQFAPKSDRWRFIGVVSAILVKAVFDTLAIGAVPAFVAIAIKPETILSYPLVADWLAVLGIGNATDLLYFGSIFLVGYYLFLAIFGLFVVRLQSRFLFGFHARLATRLFANYMSAELQFHLNRNSASLMRNIVNESEYVVTGFAGALISLFQAAITGAAIAAFLFYIEPMLTGVVVIILLIFGGGVVIVFRGWLTDAGNRSLVYRKAIIQHVTQALSLFKEVRILGRESYFVDDFGQKIQSLAGIRSTQQVIAQVPNQAMELIAIFVVMAIAGLLAWRGESLEDIAILLGMFGVALVQLRRHVTRFAASFNVLQFRAPSVFAVVNDIALLDRDRRGVATEQPVLAPGRNLVISNLQVCYDGADSAAVDGISVSFQHPSVVGIVGHTGAGKTTLIDALLGLVPATGGQFRIDDQLLDPTQAGWQRNVAYVPQAITLIDDSIRRNVALGIADLEIDDDRVREALQLAHALEFVERLPENIHTTVGERGVRMSGGQRQRIGIARALYGKPHLLVLDEGTSALDPVTEEIVIEALNTLKGTCSIILITHRHAMLDRCDMVVELENGGLKSVRQGNEDRPHPIAKFVQ